MKNKIRSLILLLVIGFMGQSCSTPSGIPSMKRGINLSHWFSQTRLPDYPPVPATHEDMQLIRSLGIDHIRLPVDPVLLREFPDGGSLNTAALKQMNAAIQLALDHGLNVVVDMHPRPDFKEKLENEPEFFQSFLEFWEVLAAHLTEYDPSRLALEILNEPMVKDPVQWQAMVIELHGVIRTTAPKHTIIIGGAEWSNAKMLCQLVPVDDPNVIYTFHFYDPHVFTHQGAKWGEPAWLKLKGVPYPLGKEQGAEMVQKISDEEARAVFQDYIDQQWDAEKINAQLAEAAAWAKAHGVEIWCGEFGVYRTYSAPEDRARYLHDVRIALEHQGIGWAMWDYQGSFSLVKEEIKPSQPDRSIAEALGLKEQP